MHLVSWSNVTSPEEEVGLGIQKTEGRNLVLLGGFTWRMRRDDRPWA